MYYLSILLLVHKRFKSPRVRVGGHLHNITLLRSTNKQTPIAAAQRQRVTRFALKCAWRVAPLRAACTHTLATAASQPHFCLIHTTQHVHETFRQLCAPKSLVCCKPDSRAHSDFCILVVSSSVGVISDLQLHRNQILCISISI